ncbi:MAG: CBS domain-containing protein [Candidatus Thermoplasmatota archaeon]|nr:CBS domain-containing protein [Candidatus Thermoplasmatota archaeon]
MKVKEFMTKDIISVDKDENLKHILNLMKKYQITKIPVLDNKKLIGMVTDNVIAYKLGSIRKKGVPASRLHASSVIDKEIECVTADTDVKIILEKVGKPGPTMLCVMENDNLVGVLTKADLLPLVTSNQKVKEIMNKKIITVSSDDRVIHARRIMIDQNLARLPVVNQGKLVGIISDNEIAFAFAAVKDSIPLGRQKHQLDELLVGDVMKSPVIWTEPDITVKDASAIMLKNNAGALPILENGKLVGIITRTDLLKTIQY